MLALLGGGLLVLEALRAALLLGVDAGASSPLRAALLLGLGGFAALDAARVLSGAPRMGAVLCLVAIALASIAHLPAVVSLLLDRYGNPYGFAPGQPSLGACLVAVLAWLVVTAPLVCAAVLAWRQSSARRRKGAGRSAWARRWRCDSPVFSATPRSSG
jgi:hypothetical protein